MEGATPNVMPVESLPLAHVGRTKPDTQQITADAAESVQTPCETHWEPDGPGHSVSDALVKLTGPGHVADDAHAQIAGPDQVGRQGCATPSHAADLDLLHAALVDGVGKQPQTSLTGDPGRLEFSVESSKVDQLPTDPNVRFPLHTSGLKRHATKGRRTSGTGHVLPVTPNHEGSEIGTATVQAVSVDVIPLEPITGSEPQQVAVQVDRDTPAGNSTGADRVTLAVKSPAPLTGPLGVRNIDQSVASDSTISGQQGNKCSSRSLVDDDGASGTNSPARTGAKRSIGRSLAEPRRSTVDQLPTANAGNGWHARLGGHQDSPPGDAPGMSQASPGILASIIPDEAPGSIEIDTLHAVLGLYARELLDVQKLRVAQGNRVSAMERDGIPEEFIAFGRDTLDALSRKERALNAYLAKQAARHPLGDWIKDQRGIGLPGFARLLGITGPLDRFATVSKLWAYLGMHVIDGAAPKRQKGERANWSPAGRVLCHQIAESIVKVGAGGPYRAAYDRKKAVYETDRPEWTQARRHNAAQRYAVKLLLKNLWVEWRRCPALSAASAARMAGASHA